MISTFSGDIRPRETDSPLVVDADAVLPRPVARECLQPVPWRDSEVVEGRYRAHLAELAQSDPVDPGVDGPGAIAVPQPLGVLAGERSDHSRSL